jgi:hypothetical protein
MPSPSLEPEITTLCLVSVSLLQNIGKRSGTIISPQHCHITKPLYDEITNFHQLSYQYGQVFFESLKKIRSARPAETNQKPEIKPKLLIYLTCRSRAEHHAMSPQPFTLASGLALRADRFSTCPGVQVITKTVQFSKPGHQYSYDMEYI